MPAGTTHPQGFLAGLDAGASAPDTAATFDGALSTKATAPDNSLYRPSGSLTISFAAKDMGTTNTYPSLAADGNDHANNGWVVLEYRPDHSVRLQYGTAYNFTAGANTIGTDRYRQYTVVYNSTAQTLSIYIDGVIDATFNGVSLTPITSNTQGFSLGGGDNPAKTSIDEFAIFPTALTSAQITALYQTGQYQVLAGGTHAYNQLDQLTDPGVSYDPLGRTSTLPANDAGAGGAISAAYYDDDMVHTLTQGTRVQSYTLDPLGRVDRTTNTVAGAATTDTLQHYDDLSAGGSQSAGWIEKLTNGSSSGWTRNIEGLDGAVAATTDNTGAASLDVVDSSGSVVATTADTNGATPSVLTGSTEFGLPRPSPSASTTPIAAGADDYGWLGGHRRDQDAPAGLTLMGERLYNPALGRFLTTDPIPGGSANSYDYANQDPINNNDLSGTDSRDRAENEGGGDAEEDEPAGTPGAGESYGGEGFALGSGSTTSSAPEAQLSRLFANDAAPSAIDIREYALRQGFVRSAKATGPETYIDSNGVKRVEIKQPSPRTPGSNFPRTTIRNSSNQRVDPKTGAVTVQHSQGAHRRIVFP